MQTSENTADLTLRDIVKQKDLDDFILEDGSIDPSSDLMRLMTDIQNSKNLSRLYSADSVSQILFEEDFKKAIYKLFETSLFDDMKQKEQDEIIFLTTKPQTTKTMKCPRCQSYQTKIMDKQLRSGDEGSDVILECESCGLKKKINSIILE